MTGVIGLLVAAVLSLDGTWELTSFVQPEEDPVRTLPLPISKER